MSRIIEVSRQQGVLTLSLTPRAIQRGGYELAWYLDSIKALYTNSGHYFAFSAQTQAVHADHQVEADKVVESLTPGQSIFFAGVMSMLGSPANGDLDDNLRTLMMLQWVFKNYDLAGSPGHTLRYTTRFTGDRYGRIVTFKEDIRALYGNEACAITCTSLAAAISRSLNKKTHFHGIKDEGGPRISATGHLTHNFQKMRYGVFDEIKSHEESWLKHNFRYVVAIARFFEDLSAQIEADEKNAQWSFSLTE